MLGTLFTNSHMSMGERRFSRYKMTFKVSIFTSPFDKHSNYTLIFKLENLEFKVTQLSRYS